MDHQRQHISRYISLKFWVLGIICQLLIALWSVSVIIRLLLQDRLPGLSALYYATPPLVLAVMALMIGAWQLMIKLHERASAWFTISAGCLIWMICTSVVIPAPLPEQMDPHTKSFKAVFWNVGRGMAGWHRILPEAQKLHPDILGLVEVGYDTEVLRPLLQQYFPEHKVSMLGGGFALLTIGQAGDCKPGILGDMGEFREVDVIVNEQDIRVCLVDIQSHPFRDRRATIEELANYALLNQHKSLLIMGDLNTPTDSLHLQKLRQYCSNAFEISGSGYIPTWPVPFPLLILDQVWINPHLVPKTATLGWNYVSDHRPICVEIMPSATFGPPEMSSTNVSSLQLLPPE